MSLVAISGNASGTGTLTVAAPNTNSNYTLTLPQTTATLGINGPAFRAYQSSAQTLSSATFTKLQFQTEVFDTNSNFDNATNYRFTPTVAGYYQINGAFTVATSATKMLVLIYKNGLVDTVGFDSGSVSISVCSISNLVYLNGSTDYVELYGYFGTGQNVFASAAYTYFSGSMVRGA
jgi:hypothetical protein